MPGRIAKRRFNTNTKDDVMNYLSVIILLLLLGFLSSFNAIAQSYAPLVQNSQTEQLIRKPLLHNVCQLDGIAVGGFDLVSYRQENGPISGSAEFAANYNELTYHFVSESNLMQFNENPEKFLPEYGGVCAVALAYGRVICPEYDNFKIENDQLLLFEVTGFTNGRTLWDSMPIEFRKKADSNFIKFNNQ